MEEKKLKKERESSDDVVMYLGGRETMAVFRNYSSLYASPLTPLDSVFRLFLTDLFVLCFVHTRHMYVRWIIHQIQSIDSELLVVKWLSTTKGGEVTRVHGERGYKARRRPAPASSLISLTL